MFKCIGCLIDIGWIGNKLYILLNHSSWVYTQHGMQQSIYTTWHATKYIHNMACNKVYTQHDMQKSIYTTCHATQYIHNMTCNTVYTQHAMQHSIYTTWHATKIIHNMACNKVYKFYNWKWVTLHSRQSLWTLLRISEISVCLKWKCPVYLHNRNKYWVCGVVVLQSIYKDEEYWLIVGHWGRKLKTKITFKVY